MIDTVHLLPPDLGPRSNPMLYGVAQAIAELFPPVMPALRTDENGPREPCQVEAGSPTTETGTGD